MIGETMKGKLGVGIMICAIGLGMFLPQTANAIVPFAPGATFGQVGFAGDTFWQSTPAPGWSTVYNHIDAITGNYWTGIEFWDLSYRNANIVPPPLYTYYIKEALIPWVAFQLSDLNWYIYGHNDDPFNGGTPMGNLMFVGPGGFGYAESAFQPFIPTTLWANYVLDMNSDGILDWTFQETVTLQGSFIPGIGWPGGQGSITIAPLAWPPGGMIQMVPGGPILTILTIRYGFIIDADVTGFLAANNIFSWNGLAWAQIMNEAAPPIIPDPNGDIGMIQDPISGLNVKIRPINPAGVGWPCAQNIYALVFNGMGEYSQFPAIYSNMQPTAGVDVLFWYYVDIFVGGIFWPPPVAPEGIYFEDLQ